jgi:hypothetical protein
MLRRVALVRTDVSEEPIASIIRVVRIGELGTLAVSSNGRTLRRNTEGQSTELQILHNYLLVVRFPLPILIPPTVPHSAPIIPGWYRRPSNGGRTNWTQYHPHTPPSDTNLSIAKSTNGR